VTEADIRAVVDAVWRMESGRVVARLVRLTGDVGLAEDFAQDALVAALEQWPRDGVPESPGAWLTTAAKRRAIDHLRKRDRRESKAPEVARELEAGGGAGLPGPEDDVAEALDDPVEDDLLRLVFTCCHPALDPSAQIALTLRLVAGLQTAEIARAFLVPEPTLAQRIVRAKRTLREARVPFETPRGEALAERRASVLEVVYLIFNEGYSATAGDEWTRPELCREALRLGRRCTGSRP
jgi:RNA polymerase sigma-70 factor, ECF subfamily